MIQPNPHITHFELLGITRAYPLFVSLRIINLMEQLLSHTSFGCVYWTFSSVISVRDGHAILVSNLQGTQLLLMGHIPPICKAIHIEQ